MRISLSPWMGLLVAIGCDSGPEAEVAVVAGAEAVEMEVEAASPGAAASEDAKAEPAMPGRAPDSPKDGATESVGTERGASGVGAPETETPADGVPLELPALGLRARAPAGTEAVPSSVDGATLVRGSDLFVVVLEAGDRPDTPEEAAARLRRVSSRKTVSRSLDDGWLLTLDTLNEFGPVLLLQVRRDLGGRAVWCESVVSWASQRDRAEALCRSLEPA